MPRSTKEEALETRSRILDAAEDVFHAKGVARTSLSDIAEAASVTRGAIYWHFKNKSDLFDAMCERVRLPIEEMAEAYADEGEQNPLGQLRNICVYVLQQAAVNPRSRKVFDILFHKCEFAEENETIATRQRECFLRGTATIERILRNAVAKGQLPADLDTALAATLLHSTVDGLLNRWLFAPGSFDLEGRAARLIDACLHSLAAPPMRKEG